MSIHHIRAAPRLPPLDRLAFSAPGRSKLGRILIASGQITSDQLHAALRTQRRQDLHLGDLLLARGLLDEASLFSALSKQWQAPQVQLQKEPPDLDLIYQIGPQICLKYGFVPLKRTGVGTVIATSNPAEFERLKPMLPDSWGRLFLAIAPLTDVHACLTLHCGGQLAHAAEARIWPQESCRSWHTHTARHLTLLCLCLFIVLTVLRPTETFLTLSLLAILSLLFMSGLKLAATLSFVFQKKAQTSTQTAAAVSIARLPKVSVLIPLYKETKLTRHLLHHLQRLTYPKELLEICLVVESDDVITQTCLAGCNLPPWVRTIKVPIGQLRTKPRAMNYALDFCRGSIIGIYDAEDAPEPGQIETIVHRFHARGPDVACLQGVLDYYNVSQNWLSRCFTIEYAAWFRVLLPGLAQLGVPIPLGGTTVFFRREALEALGGWDAHNVTEDADLGLRLARHGFRTELVQTTTYEEANCRFWPWVRQRSRWIKGYAVTWAVHLRAPARLKSDLGWWRFWGVQLLFGGSLLQYLLAPILWSFWLLPFGLPHPIRAFSSPGMIHIIVSLFLLAETLTIVIGIIAVSQRGQRGLIAWVPTMHFYFPLAVIAAGKAAYELLTRPFFWDKTDHGVSNLPAPATRSALSRWHRKP